MNNPVDPVLAKIATTADQWHHHMEQASNVRADLNQLVVWAKNEGYSYKTIARAAGLSVATIQLIVTKKTPSEGHTRSTYWD